MGGAQDLPDLYVLFTLLAAKERAKFRQMNLKSGIIGVVLPASETGQRVAAVRLLDEYCPVLRHEISREGSCGPVTKLDL